jgi:uncharacterized protein (UPF0548 family)
MFRLTRSSRQNIEMLITEARELPVSSTGLLTMQQGLIQASPRGFAHDVSRSRIGRGRQAFTVARKAIQRWDEFDLGWVQIANPLPRIAPGELVAVEVRTAYLWSINISRITEVVDSPTRFGFLYSTTALHVEEGQERFVIEFDPASESVSYLIEAVSRPRHIFARIGHPFSRAMQHRFARDAQARLKRCVPDADLQPQ